ncbi:hypothetical protein TAFFO16_4 [Bacillus phage Taffo16]|uniref:Uncharacterized protein n=1 Tax=Bacillus phage Taffo16 TaxID=2030094 RepID=A0A249XUV6_9CAUD|nr:hypothetical protein TAFFO16_4 [Bacillus phage Taffo16]ULF48625.1 membrane protein [Bacillus phage BillyBob]
MFNLIVGAILLGMFLHNEYKRESGEYVLWTFALLVLWVLNLGYGLLQVL